MAGVCVISGGAPTHQAPKVFTLSLPPSGWEGSEAPYSQTLTVEGMYASGYFYLPHPTPESHAICSSAGIVMQTITTDKKISFKAQMKPASDVYVNVVRWHLGE